MAKADRSIFKQLLPGLLLGITVLIGLAVLANLRRVSSILASFHWIGFALAIALNFLSQTLRFLKKAINLHRSGISNVSSLDSMSLFLACLPLSVTSTHIGDSYRGIWLFKKSGVPVERAVSVFMVDQISDVLSVFVLMVIGTFSFPALWPLFLILFLAFIGMLIYFKLPRTVNNPSGMSDKVPVLKSIIPKVRECIDANPTLFSIPNMLVIFLLGIVSWATEGAALFTILIGLGFEPTLQLVATAILVFAFASTISIASRLPGGLGVMEVAMAVTLTLLLKFQPEKAVVSTILFRLATFWFTFLLGLILWSVAGKKLGVYQQEGRIIEG